MAATDANSDCADCIGKWHAREPEMRFAEPFCPRLLRVRFRLWGALLLELREAAFELSDARVIEAKTAWWAEELARSAQHAARHPLTQALLREPMLQAQTALPWSQLGRALLASAASDPRPADSDAAIAGMRPLAEAMPAFEAALFGEASLAAGREPAQPADAANASVAHLLGERLRVGLHSEDGGRIPLSLLARHRITVAQLVEPVGAAAIADRAQQLLLIVPVRLNGASLYRRARWAYDRRSLQRIAQQHAATPAHPLRALWMAWAAARHSPHTAAHAQDASAS